MNENEKRVGDVLANAVVEGKISLYSLGARLAGIEHQCEQAASAAKDLRQYILDKVDGGVLP